MYHERVMHRSHVLRLGCHVIDMFYMGRAVKNTDLEGQRAIILRENMADDNVCKHEDKQVKIRKV